MEISRDVIEQFDLDPARIFPLTMGLINKTYRAETGRGVFILQKQHPIFNSYTVQIVDSVARHLAEKGILSPQVVKTKEGQSFFVEEGSIWRLLTFIPGKVVEVISNHETAFEAGRILGQFHQAMADFDLDIKIAIKIHNTPAVYRSFIQATDHLSDPTANELRGIVVKNLPNLFLPEKTSMTVIHGDPKISNIVFDDNLLRARALIDLDLCQRNKLLFDLGDAFRSWCSGLEDGSDHSFDTELFTKALGGYLGSCQALTREDLELLVQAIKLITLELSARFLKDYVLDSYFGWDQKRYCSRKEHNLARALGQVKLFQNIALKEKDLFCIINKLRNQS